MKPSLLTQLEVYVEQRLPEFHQKRLEKLATLKLKAVLSRKNPYLFRAKAVNTSEMLVRQILDAHLSSQEETIFGDFLEALAIHVCESAYGGRKSTTEGIDLEFERDDIRYIVSIKSGPNWGNSSQLKKMRDQFRQARKVYGSKRALIAVNGCCYGKEVIDRGDYQKLCGQAFWSLISGEESLYTDLVEPLGRSAKTQNAQFLEEYDKVVNRCSRELLADFCHADGSIDWIKLVAFTSATRLKQ